MNLLITGVEMKEKKEKKKVINVAISQNDQKTLAEMGINYTPLKQVGPMASQIIADHCAAYRGKKGKAVKSAG